MLKKLVKYEFKSVSRILLPLYGAVLILGIVNGIMFNLSINEHLNGVFANSLMGVFIFLYAIALWGTSIFTLILILNRFFKSMFGNEGYLTHTLPVSSTTHIFSKVISSVIWFFINGVAVVLSLVLMALLIEPSALGNTLQVISRGWKEIVYYMSGAHMAFFIIEGIVAAIVSSVCGVLMFFSAMSLGQLATKNKILASFGAYVHISFVINLVSTILASVFIENVFSTASGVAMGHIVLCSMILFCGILSCVFFLINKEILDNRLNLE